MNKVEELIESNDKILEECRNKIEYRFDRSIGALMEDPNIRLSSLLYFLIEITFILFIFIISFILGVMYYAAKF